MAQDQGAQLFALGARDQLRVGKTGDVTLRMEDDGSGHHRAGEAAPADLVDTGDVTETDAAQRVLERTEGGDAGHGTTPRAPAKERGGGC
jgi:hypothetical protein